VFQEERLIAIVRYLEEAGRISAEQICELFQVSRDTARRDLVRLEEEKKIVRTRGGAILPTLTKDVLVYNERLQTEPASKMAIGRTAASLVKDGDYVIMEASTTVQTAAEYWQSKNNVVVTNSIDVAGVLADKNGVTVHLLGGVFYGNHRSVYGARTVEALADYHVDRLFIGACGLSVGGLTNLYEEEGFLIREMMRRSDQVILLADHSKFGKRLFHRFAALSDVDIVITDRMPDGELAEALQQNGVEVITASQLPHS
jgi:DeoR/GlpR family transcriptional regulator of sugar metabolism